MAQVKEQIKAPEKIQVSSKQIANLSDAQFKTLVIRMLTKMTEYCHKLKEEAKAMQSEIKKNIQGTNSKGKETGTHLMIWSRRKKETFIQTGRRGRDW